MSAWYLPLISIKALCGLHEITIARKEWRATRSKREMILSLLLWHSPNYTRFKSNGFAAKPTGDR
jgi:hypothetical protein